MNRREFAKLAAAAGASIPLASLPGCNRPIEKAESSNKENVPAIQSNNDRSFPTGFYWSTATAAYQVEGAWNEDGKGKSIWDTFAHIPGRMTSGDTGNVATDHYHRYKKDVKLMKDIGSNTYRFSIS